MGLSFALVLGDCYELHPWGALGCEQCGQRFPTKLLVVVPVCDGSGPEVDRTVRPLGHNDTVDFYIQQNHCYLLVACTATLRTCAARSPPQASCARLAGLPPQRAGFERQASPGVSARIWLQTFHLLNF